MGNIHQNDKGSCLSWIAQIFQPGMRNWSASSVWSTGIGTGYIGNHIDFKCSESSLGLIKREARKLSSFYKYMQPDNSPWLEWIQESENDMS